MQKISKLHRNESGQAALENAIILIAFIVVASVFAFTILSAGSSSTEKGEQAIYEGLESVQSSMNVKGAVIATAADAGPDKTVVDVVFTLALAGGGEPVDLTTVEGKQTVVIGYRDGETFNANVPWENMFIVNNDNGTADTLLEEGELAEVTVHLSAADPAVTLGANTEFTLEVKPPTGAVLTFTRTTPASVEKVMELR
ncbi:MAG: hypothetical protein K8J31_24850 [Anaerolineae bacterium]|nr:hypothetical protein [Anaerolineae bacterium]